MTGTRSIRPARRARRQSARDGARRGGWWVDLPVVSWGRQGHRRRDYRGEIWTLQRRNLEMKWGVFTLSCPRRALW
ncbi:MAG: hypothetical protein MPL62_14165 [Alphaproteobacteria bacterium]|nr:hypothetical protein [Alphaproteobacteria bacterium]